MVRGRSSEWGPDAADFVIDPRELAFVWQQRNDNRKQRPPLIIRIERLTGLSALSLLSSLSLKTASATTSSLSVDTKRLNALG